MEKVDALKSLLAKVEAGELSDMRHTPFNTGVEKAFNGSLDAAKVMHDAVLPGWHFDIATEANRKGFYCSLSPKEWGKAYIATSCTPARAWLIAIIKALIAQEIGA